MEIPAPTMMVLATDPDALPAAARASAASLCTSGADSPIRPAVRAIGANSEPIDEKPSVDTTPTVATTIP